MRRKNRQRIEVQREMLIEKIDGETTLQELYNKLKAYDERGLEVAYSGRGFIIEDGDKGLD